MQLLHRPRQEDALAEVRPELGRDGQPVLGVEVVFEGAGEGQGACQIAKRKGGQSIPGGGVGGAPPPGNGFARGKVPHFAPLCNTEPAFRPTSSHCGPCVCVESARFAGTFVVGRFSCRSALVLQRRLHPRDLHAGLRVRGGRSGPFGGRSGRNWRQRVVSAGISAAATSSSTAGTSRSATTSWIFGAAFAACSERCAALQRARLGGLGGERGGEWGAVALGALERGDQLRDAGRRARAPRAGSAPARRARPSSARSAARSSSCGEQCRGGAGRPRCSARRGASPAAIATRSRSSTSGSSASIALRARAGAGAQGVFGGEVAGGGRGQQEREAEPPGRERWRAGARRAVASSASPACSATISLVGRSIPAAAARAARPPEGLTPSLAPRRATARRGEPGRRGRRRARSVSPAAAASAARVARRIVTRAAQASPTAARAVRRGRASRGRRTGSPRGRGRALRRGRRSGRPRRSLTGPTLRVRRRTATSAMSCRSSARQVSQAETGFVEQAVQEAGLGELGEDGRAAGQDEHDPRGEARLGGGRERVAVLARGGLEREREVAQQRGQVAARVALEQDAGDHRVPGGRARAAAQPLEHGLGRRAEAQRLRGLAELVPRGARARRRRRPPARRGRRGRPRARRRTRARRPARTPPARPGTVAGARARAPSRSPGRRRRRRAPRPGRPTSQPAAASTAAASTPSRRRSATVGDTPSRPARTTGATARARRAATRVRSTAASSSHTPTTAAAAAPNASATAISGHLSPQSSAA